MIRLQQAHLQRRYRPILIGFLILVLGTLGGVVYAGSSITTITVTPILRHVTNSFPITFGSQETKDTYLHAEIDSTSLSESITVTPTGQTATTKAHASGSVILHNESSQTQVLAATTRLQSSNGVIVRLQNRVDLSPGTTLTASAVADPLGSEGEIAPGRLIIVALWPGLQAKIYGTVAKAFSGGLVADGASLSLDELTTASDQAEQKIRQTFGQSSPGTFRILQPTSIISNPPSDRPSNSYKITVTMKALTVRYSQTQLKTTTTALFDSRLADDEKLLLLEEPTVTFEDQPSNAELVVTVQAKGTAALSADSAVLQSDKFTGRTAEDITSTLLGTKAIKTTEVKISPWWRTTTPAQPQHIKVVVHPPAA